MAGGGTTRTEAKAMVMSHNGDWVKLGEDASGAELASRDLHREVGGERLGPAYILIADMVESTRIKSLVYDALAFALVADHNQTVIDVCTAPELGGRLIDTVGDAVFVLFEGDEATALANCLEAARLILLEFRQRKPFRTKGYATGDQMRLRTKVTLHYFDECMQYRLGPEGNQVTSLVGHDIDLAFRVASICYPMQIVATDALMAKLQRYVTPLCPREGREGEVDRKHLLARATEGRDQSTPQASDVGCLDFRGRAFGREIWIPDARRVGHLRGIDDAQDVFLLAMEDPGTLASDCRHELRVKLDQGYHAVIMVNLSVQHGRSENYIRDVRETLEPPDGVVVEAGYLNSRPPERMDSKLTLCVAAKVFGIYDFFFRVSCADDRALHEFFRKLQGIENYTIEGIEVRQTVRNRFWVNRNWDKILAEYRGSGGDGSYNLILTWFEEHGHRDLFEEFYERAREGVERARDVHILECGEVVHHTPIYALFICRDLSAYEGFFDEAKLHKTKSTSYIVHTPDPSERFCLLRYQLVNGIYISEPQLYHRRPGEAVLPVT